MSILHLAHRWGFESIKQLAITNLSATLPGIERIALGRRYGIDHWLCAAYQAVCTREDPPSVKECSTLEVEDIMRISAIRQAYRRGGRFSPDLLAGDIPEILGLVDVAAEKEACMALEDEEEMEMEDFEMSIPLTAIPCELPAGGDAQDNDGNLSICWRCFVCANCVKEDASREEALKLKRAELASRKRQRERLVDERRQRASNFMY